MFEMTSGHFVVIQTLDINLAPVARQAGGKGKSSYDLGFKCLEKWGISFHCNFN